MKAGSLGGAVFRTLKPGGGYRVATAAGKKSKPVTVLSNRSAPPSTSIYNQKIPTSGYGYVTTRDGTKLALDVHLPAGATPGGGPYPTLFEYAGYGYADPFNGPDSGIAQIANLLGFAVVDVNMRGTGCSGGAYDYFEPLQGLDGYDVIETVARQPWVLHHKVGMIGVSYGGISQLFVAETQPPSLAAIAPLSVIDDSTTTLYAGGILNTGFTVPWIKDRVNDALPATATGGQSWALKQIQRRRRDVQGQPGAAPVGRQPAGQGRPQPLLRAEGRRPAVADHVRAQDQRAGVPGLPVHRRADRWALPGHRVAFHGHRAQVVHVHQRRPHRLARSADVPALVRLPRAVRRPTGAESVAGAVRRRADALQRGARRAQRPDPAARPAPGPELRRGAGGVPGAAAGPGSVRQRRRRHRAGPAASRLRAVVRIVPDARARPRSRGTWRRAARWPTPSPPAARPTSSRGTRTRSR